MRDKLATGAMEYVQVIAWTIEIVTLIVTILIAWAVWKVTRKAVREKRSMTADNEKP